MKRSCFLAFLLGVLLLSGEYTSAQPPQVPPATKNSRSITERQRAMQLQRASELSPELVAHFFLSHFREGNFRSAALLVAGADWESRDLDLLRDLHPHLKNLTRWNAFSPEPPAERRAETEEVSLRTLVGVLGDDLDLSSWHPETVRLRREKLGAYSIWRIVPGETEASYAVPTRLEIQPIVERMAALTANPLRTRDWLAERIATTRMQELGRSMKQYLQNEQQQIPATLKLQQDLRPYARNDKINFATSPLDAEGTESFSLNDNLLSISLGAGKNLEDLVMLYDGQDGQLNFRYGNRGLVCFADGSIRFIDAEAAKTLRWKF